MTETLPLPEEGLPGIDKDIVLTDTVTLHLADSAFSGSGRTAIMTPTLTFGPNAVGTYNIEFRVDDEDGEIQDDDVLGQITIVPNSCPYAVVEGQVDGPDSGSTDTDYLYTASVVPVQASQPISFTWSPEPKSGQGTAAATYNWSSAGERILSVSAENCGGFAGDVKTVQIRTTEAPDLSISKIAPSVATAGDRITYTLTVSNSGSMPAYNLEITDVVPEYATYVSGGALQSGIVSWDVGQLDGYGASTQVQYVVTASQTITNGVISVSADGDHSAYSNEPVVTIIADDTAKVDGVTDGSLVGETIDVDVDAGSFANSAQLALTELDGPTYPLPETVSGVSAATMQVVKPLRSFQLRSFGIVRGGQFFSVTANMGISYVLAPLTAAEGSATEIGLRYWTGSEWSDEGISCVAESTALECVVQAPFDTEYVVLETTASGNDTEIVGLAASNDGPTKRGNATSLSATITSGSGISYLWDFGDGSSATGATPSHVYAASGTYTVKVTASNSVNTQVATTVVEVADAVIEVRNFEFVAKDVTVPAGSRVIWVRVEGNHNVNADNGEFRSGDPSSLWATYSFTFDSEGTYPYYCELHGASGGSGMSGTVNVSPSSSNETEIFLPFVTR